MRSPGISTFFCATLAFAMLMIGLLLQSPVPTAAAMNSPSPSSTGPPSTVLTSTAQIFLPIISGPPPARVRIAAAHIDSTVSYEPDEALLLWNMGYSAQSLAGWQLVSGSRHATFPMTATLTLNGGERIWCTGVATAFRTSFGDSPACEWTENSDPEILNLDGSLQFANHGGLIQLLDAEGGLVDTLVYGDEDTTVAGWNGAPAQLYARGAIREAGQIWHRKRDPDTSQPIDTDNAQDWAGDLADIAWGRQVRRPGWRGWTLDDLGAPTEEGMAEGEFTVAVGPEGLYAPLADAFNMAISSIDLSIYTLEHPELTDRLVAALERGVRVRILLEGGPAGGISDLQKWCVARLAASGGDIRYMATVDDAPNGLKTRYSYAHAKYGIIDERFAFVGTDNMNWDSMPVAGGEQGTRVGGRRGYYLLTDAGPIIDALNRIFMVDWAPDLFMDLYGFTPDHDKYGGPPDDFVLPERPIYEVGEAPFTEPVMVSGAARFMVVSAPENATRPDRGLMALIARAGAGDEILVEQLYEHKFWGDSISNPIADPNPRLEAIIDAARRGARVRLLLDSHFGDLSALRSNQATVEYVQAVAMAERLDMDARIGDPTGGGIHAKLVLLRIGEENWSTVSSLNGGEVSHKLNREVLLLVDLADIHARLATVFDFDWRQSAIDRE